MMHLLLELDLNSGFHKMSIQIILFTKKALLLMLKKTLGAQLSNCIFISGPHDKSLPEND